MGSRVSVDPLAGYGPLVDKSLGDAYKTVRIVADNLPALLAIPTLDQLQAQIPVLTSPGPIGSVAPSTGAFTTLSASSIVNLGSGFANFLTVTGAAAASNPVIAAAGSDTNIDVQVTPKGTGWLWSTKAWLSPSAPSGSDTFRRLNVQTPVVGLTPTTGLVRFGGNFFSAPLAAPFVGALLAANIDSDSCTFTNTNHGFTGSYFGHAMIAGWSGGRTTLVSFLNITGAGTAGIDAYHVAGSSEVRASADMGGVVGTYRGNVFARNELAFVKEGAGPNVLSILGEEFNVSVEGTARVLWKGGVKVVQWVDDTSQGLQQDMAYGLSNQSGGTAPGWRIGFGLGGVEGWWPFRTSSTIMKAVAGMAGEPSMASGFGIDLRDIAFSAAPFASPGFYVGATGNIGSLTSSGVALQTRSGVFARTAVVNTIAVLEGGLFTGAITLTLSAPTTSGTTATAVVSTVKIPAIASMGGTGTGYAVNDTVTFSGGTFSTACVGVVTKISGSAVAAIRISTEGNYSVLPAFPAATTTSGAGTGLTLTPNVSILTATVTLTGTNYSEFLPPTVASAGAAGTLRMATFAVAMTPTQVQLQLNNGKVNVTGIPTASAGLSAGDLWSNSGVLTVV